jgi:PAS domain S-box-containing protein
LEAAVKLLTSPVFVRMAAVFLLAVAGFVVAIVAIRMLRRRIVEDDFLGNSSSEDSIPLHTATVIQQLKQQKFVLQSEQQVERRRAKTSEHITTAIIANLPYGMLFTAPNGLVRQANTAARQILGFASPLGLSVGELFRDARVISESRSELKVAEVFERALRGKAHPDTFESRYFAANGEERMLKLTLIPVCEPSGVTMGVACAITDTSEIAELRQLQVVRAEISAEMALELRTSLSTMREWAEQMSVVADPMRTRSLAADLSAEAERLNKLVGGFLAGRDRARAAEA